MVDLNKPPLRMQVALTTAAGTFLQAEVIGEWEAFRTYAKEGGYWEQYAQLKYDRGLPCGGIVIRRADLPRLWDVPVGSRIKGSSMRYYCYFCGKSVSSELPDDSVIRATLICPECIEAGKVKFTGDKK